jgi:hypothetical protein
MVQDRLTEAVLSRFKELGLPPSLIDVGGFRDNFLFRQWVMFTRDGDETADVHLIQPWQAAKPKVRKPARANRG